MLNLFSLRPSLPLVNNIEKFKLLQKIKLCNSIPPTFEEWELTKLTCAGPDWDLEGLGTVNSPSQRWAQQAS